MLEFISHFSTHKLEPAKNDQSPNSNNNIYWYFLFLIINMKDYSLYVVKTVNSVNFEKYVSMAR